MKRLLSILLFCCLALPVVTQEETRVIDSLESVIAKQEGPDKVESMMELSRAFFDFSFDDCINWGEKAIVEATKLQDVPLLARAYWKIGLRYMNHYEFDLAINYFDQALGLMEDIGDSELLMDILNYKGRVELFMGDMNAALLTYQHAMKVSERIGDKQNCADVLNNMAYIYFQQDDLNKAMECFNDARQRYEWLQDTLSMAQCDNNISNIFVQWQQYDNAQSLLQQAIPIFEQNDDQFSLAHAYQNLGAAYAIGLVNYDSAMVYLQKSIVCAENVGDQITLIEDELELAGILLQINREKEAISLYQSALHSSEIIQNSNGMLEAYKSLGIHYNELGDFTTSAVYLKRCMDLASEKGNLLYVNTVRPYLIADYARLGQLMEMKKELGLLQDDYMNIINENNVLSEELSRLQINIEGLLDQYDSQNNQIQSLQTELNHYRLAFFGLLAIVLFMAVLFVAYKIVRKNRSKSVKP